MKIKCKICGGKKKSTEYNIKRLNKKYRFVKICNSCRNKYKQVVPLIVLQDWVLKGRNDKIKELNAKLAEIQ